MPLVISDAELQAMELDEPNARIEIACRLFDAGRLSLPAAAKFGQISRAAMEGALRQRQIAIYRPTVKDLHDDLEVLRDIGNPQQ
jgi:predicted HTH domain antitoxin